MNSKLSILKLLELLLWLAAGLYLVNLLLPIYEKYVIYYNAEPKIVKARGDLADNEKSTIEIFNHASPSVVFISKEPISPSIKMNDVRKIPKGSGSGFIWDKFGHIVTNYHVIAGASEVNVHLSNDSIYKASVVGASPDHDLAVLKIDVLLDLPPILPFGTSSDLQIGQSVFSIGNSFGLNYTFSNGIVSALDRTVSSDIYIIVINDLIQTNAVIPNGHSGGPLLDSSGRLIGINTAIYGALGAYNNIGYAVPVDTVNKVIPELIAHGKYTLPESESTLGENK